MASLIQRNGTYYIQFCVSGKARRLSTGTDNYQLAKEKVRQFDSAQMRGDGNPLPTRTPIADVVGRYVDQMRTRKTSKSAQTSAEVKRIETEPFCLLFAPCASRRRIRSRCGSRRFETGGTPILSPSA